MHRILLTLGTICFIIGGVLGVSLIVDVYTQMTSPSYPVQPTPAKQEVKSADTTSPSSDFIQVCSGLDINTEQTRILATANCLGRVRGYADSHQQTIKMLQQTYAISKGSQLWCIPKTVTDKQLLTVVLDWADANPAEYDSVTSKYNGTAGAMGVLAAALRATFPCTR